jgi:CheY-like chemotaxis protein
VSAVPGPTDLAHTMRGSLGTIRFVLSILEAKHEIDDEARELLAVADIELTRIVDALEMLLPVAGATVVDGLPRAQLAAGASVLVVDDADVAATTVRRVLERAGYVVRCVATLADASSLVTTWHPAAIVVDHDLPDGNGLDFARSLRANQSTAATRVVMLTGSHQVGGDPAVDHFLRKPVTPGELLDALEG